MKKHFIIVALVLAAGLPSFASAQSSQAGKAACVKLTRDLAYGSRDAAPGGEVFNLQAFLVAKGLITAAPSGYFGLATQKGVKDFQKANTISPTGFVGPATRAKINALSSCAGSPAATPVAAIETPKTSAPVVAPKTDTGNVLPIAATTPPKEAAHAPSAISLTPISGAVGTLVHIYGINFSQRSVISIDGNLGVSIAPVKVGYLAAGSGLVDGMFVDFLIPESLAAGDHKIQVFEKSSTLPNSAPLIFTVIGKTLPAPVLSSITPTTVKPGGTITVRGKNFSPNIYVIFDGEHGQLVWPDAPPLSGATEMTVTVPASFSSRGYTLQLGVLGATFPLTAPMTLNVAGAQATLSIKSPQYSQTLTSSAPFLSFVWSTMNMDSNYKINITLTGAVTYTVVADAPNTGSYTFVPSAASAAELPDGTYTVKICGQLKTPSDGACNSITPFYIQRQ